MQIGYISYWVVSLVALCLQQTLTTYPIPKYRASIQEKPTFQSLKKQKGQHPFLTVQ